jgi:hypothetical protein
MCLFFSSKDSSLRGFAKQSLTRSLGMATLPTPRNDKKEIFLKLVKTILYKWIKNSTLSDLK